MQTLEKQNTFFLDFFQCFMKLNCIMKWFSSFSKEQTKILSKHLERAQLALILFLSVTFSVISKCFVCKCEILIYI